MIYDDYKKKECLFSINRMNKYYLLPFLVPLVCYSTKFFSEPMKMKNGQIKYVQDVTEENCHTFVFLYQMINSTSLIFGGLLYFVTIIRTKTENKANIGNLIGERVLSDNSIKIRNRPNRLLEFSIIIFMSIIITMYNVLKGYGTKHPTLEKRLYFLFFFFLINVFMFKKPIYSHQKFSLGIGLVGMAIIFTVFFFYVDYARYEYIYDVLLFFGSFLYSLYLVLVKYMAEKKYYSPFLLLLLIGTFSTIITIIGYIVYSYFTVNDLRYVTNIFHCRDDMYVCFGNYYDKIICYFLINAVLQVLIFLVCYYFSPEVFAISDIISPYLSFISKVIEKKNTDLLNIIFNSVGYITIILCSFVYNEIIVCNFCGLNENTWKAIDQKANEDYMGMLDRDSNTIGDYEIDNNNGRKSPLNHTLTELSMSTSINENSSY
jgi:hypothetical protein